MKSYTSILEETLEEELFMSNLNTLRIEIDKKYKILNCIIKSDKYINKKRHL